MKEIDHTSVHNGSWHTRR